MRAQPSRVQGTLGMLSCRLEGCACVIARPPRMQAQPLRVQAKLGMLSCRLGGCAHNIAIPKNPSNATDTSIRRYMYPCMHACMHAVHRSCYTQLLKRQTARTFIASQQQLISMESGFTVETAIVVSGGDLDTLDLT